MMRPHVKPKAGDRKTVKGITYVRQFRRSPEGHLVVSGSRFLYEWVRAPNKDKS